MAIFASCGEFWGLKGHCPRCHNEIHNCMGNTEYKITEAMQQCYRCFEEITLYDDGHICLACDIKKQNEQNQLRSNQLYDLERRRVEALEALARQGASRRGSSNTFPCFHCGSPRPRDGLYCPYCRLNNSGRTPEMEAARRGY